MVRLGVNIDHVATLRNARGECFPSVVEAALIAETNGADLITVHLREDRRHIQDNDVRLLKQSIKTQLNLEMAVTNDMLDFALEVCPEFVCLVPEKRQELTTEGGLNILSNTNEIARMVNVLNTSGILTSLFIEPSSEQVKEAANIGAYAIEIHTGKYAKSKSTYYSNDEYYKIKEMSELAHSLGLKVNAGHGLNYHNVMPIARLKHMHELNIGFAIISQSLFCGLPNAILQMKQLISV